MKRVAYVSGTRADYGLMLPVLQAIDKSRFFELEIIATGMHIMPEFGSTICEIENDGFKPQLIRSIYSHDVKASMASFAGELTQKLAAKLAELRPDIVMVLGDRAEMLAGAIAGTYLGIPVAHVHGGDISSTVDEPVRHAIAKLAHIHFPATKKSARRLIKMGEEPWRVHMVGSSAIDGMLFEACTSADELAARFSLDLSQPLLLVIQHPVSLESNQAANQMKETLDAIIGLSLQTVVIFPNADTGGRAMIRVINTYKHNSYLRIFKSIARRDYLGLMKIVSVIVGNSSSGIIEAPSFELPAVNIGTRQEGRERSCNVIDVGYETAQIARAIRKVLGDEEVRQKIKNCRNPYGDGKTSERIVKVLTETEVNEKLLQKRMTY